MKISFFIMLFLLFLIPSSFACINSLDDYALELILNKPNITYDLGKLAKAQPLNKQDNVFILQSQYNKELASIIKETNQSEKLLLSIRLQLPAKTEAKAIPYFSFISSLANKKISSLEEFTFFNGWKILSISSLYYEAKKDNIHLVINSAKNKYDLVFEINDFLQGCKNCEGKCIQQSLSNPYGEACLDSRQKKEINTLLAFLFNSSFEDLFYNFRVIGKGEKIVTDLSQLKQEIDFSEALKQELVFLKKNSIVNIDDKDISNLAKLADKGMAGNSRIVYGNGNWVYYYASVNPALTKELNCQEFSPVSIPSNTPVFQEEKISVYYLVPILISISFVLALIVIILLARLIVKKSQKKNLKKETSQSHY